MKSAHPSRESYEHAAWMLACDVPAIMAVAEVEAGQHGAWLSDGMPVILPEPHLFHQLTGGKYDRVLPTLSYPKWKPGSYGPMSEQHSRLQRMASYDRVAALKAASWGLFQIMGYNYRRAGHPTLQSFVNAAYESVDDHLRMFVSFILSGPNGDLAKALRSHDWRTFARIYNGPGFEKNGYHAKMAAAYQRLQAAGE